MSLGVVRALQLSHADPVQPYSNDIPCSFEPLVHTRVIFGGQRLARLHVIRLRKANSGTILTWRAENYGRPWRPGEILRGARPVFTATDQKRHERHPAPYIPRGNYSESFAEEWPCSAHILHSQPGRASSFMSAFCPSKVPPGRA
jgi:hypothetical protein